MGVELAGKETLVPPTPYSHQTMRPRPASWWPCSQRPSRWSTPSSRGSPPADSEVVVAVADTAEDVGAEAAEGTMVEVAAVEDGGNLYPLDITPVHFPPRLCLNSVVEILEI